MQAVLPKWKTAFIFNKVVVQSSTIIPHVSHFHSTAPTLEKWKPKNKNSDKRGYGQPIKNRIKFVVRQRRANAKLALKDMLFGNGFTKFSSEPLPRMKERLEEVEADRFSKKQRAKTAARREAKAKRTKRLQKERREKIYEEYDENPNIFRATFGNKSYTWAFNSDGVPPFQRWDRRKLNESDIESESDEKSCFAASFAGKDSDRLVLGLPAKSPLKIDDVKNAFRLSALKWHPDRHQGSTQANAEEKFKRCVDAYKSLCDALSTA